MSDPIPTQEQENGKKSKQFVDSISYVALQQLGELRDQVDDLCRQIRAKQDDLEKDIDEHIQFAATAIKAKLEISKGIEQVASYFPPRPAPTITQRNGNGSHR